MRGEQRTQEDAAYKEEETKVAQKRTERREKLASCCKIFVLTFSDY